MQEVSGALRVCGGGKDGALVLFENFQPAIDVSGMIIANLGGDPEIGGKKC